MAALPCSTQCGMHNHPPLWSYDLRAGWHPTHTPPHPPGEGRRTPPGVRPKVACAALARSRNPLTDCMTPRTTPDCCDYTLVFRPRQQLRDGPRMHNTCAWSPRAAAHAGVTMCGANDVAGTSHARECRTCHNCGGRRLCGSGRPRGRGRRRSGRLHPHPANTPRTRECLGISTAMHATTQRSLAPPLW